MSRHLMEPDPEAEGPTFRQVAWFIVLILAFVLLIATHAA